MAKPKPGMAYDTKKLNRVFAVISILFLFSVFWVFLDDYIRPWKVVQVKGWEVHQQVLENQLKKLEETIDSDQVQTLIAGIGKAEEKIQERQDEIDKIQVEKDKLDAKLYAEKLINGKFNANHTALQFQYEMALDKGKPNAKKLGEKFFETRRKFFASNEKVKEYRVEEEKLDAQIASIEAEKTSLERQLNEIIGRKNRMEESLARATPNLVTVIRNMPFLDFMDPTIKIRQVVLKNYEDDRYFQQIPKVDRCTTCHMFSDQPGFENQDNPYKTHPNLELMVGAKSAHPHKQFGCTTCHGGEGQRVNDFTAAAHTPENKEQANVWKEKYHWHEPHKIPEPMLKLSQTEASCVKCHANQEYIPQGTIVNEGRQLIETYGCYACHKIEGWQYKEKPGPSLKKIPAKINKEFAKAWIWNPHEFNKHSKMPAFFNQSNNSKPEFIEKNIAEVNAMVDYMWDKAESYKPVWKYKGGNKEKGKKLISEVGCLGCHSVEGIESKSFTRKGSYLTGTGSKVDPDWLVTWLIKPSHYQEDTVMPSFRLNQREANDIASYLMSLKNESFAKLKFAKLDGKVRDEILLDYFDDFEPLKMAQVKLDKMSDHERTMELGQRSIGKYGCYSCHNVQGFDGRGPIGPELTKIGSKPTEQFGWGHEHIPHHRDVWISHHLENPRRWDNGVMKTFKDLTRMPNFYLNKREIKAMTTALLGQVDAVGVPERGLKKLTAHEQLVEDGRRVINKYNCMGCHSIDGVGGEILANYEDYNLAPPYLNNHGARVRTDWLNNFLLNVFPIRPQLEVRMPSFNFSNDEVNKIVQYFQAASKKETFENLPAQIAWEPGERKAALQLWENLACTSCHAAGFNNDPPQAPNLFLARRKLRPDWIIDWFKNPQGIIEGTLMPSFWEGGESLDPDTLGGDPEKQMRALQKYLYELGYKDFAKGQRYLGDSASRSPLKRFPSDNDRKE